MVEKLKSAKTVEPHKLSEGSPCGETGTAAEVISRLEKELDDLEAENAKLAEENQRLRDQPIVKMYDEWRKRAEAAEKELEHYHETTHFRETKKRNELKVFTHNFQLGDTYFGAFKTQKAFVECGMKRGGINFRIENHILDETSENNINDLNADIYKFAIEHPNKVFYTPVRARDGFKPNLWSE